MAFHARIGVLPHESELPQPVEIDLSVWPSAATPTVIDYRALYAVAAESVGSQHTAYLEDLAERVVTRALRLPGVSAARAAVRKPHVALPGPLAYAEVVLERTAEAPHPDETHAR